MNRLFADMIDKSMAKVNPVVMNGLACYYMKFAEQYIDEVFRSASRSFPEGLQYVGYERCTPQEEYEEVTRVRNNKRTYDLARSDIYLVKYKFTFKGEPIPNRYIYLPYVNDGGIIYLGGAQFHVTPVLSDKVISPGFDSVFVRLLRDKINFKRCYHTVTINGRRETTNIVWSKIYRKPQDNKKVPITTKALTSAAHYLFAKYGFTDTFKKYCGFVPVIGESEINNQTYPENKWIICESCQVKPTSFIGEYYTPTNIRLAIPIEKWDAMTKGLVYGFFYVVDHFPDRFKPGYVDSKVLWMTLIGHIVFSGNYGENKLITSIEEHFLSLDDYVDLIVTQKLRETGFEIENFYDLLALIIKNFNTFINENESSVLSMYGKSLEVLYYVLYDITAGIFKVNFKLSKQVNKKPLTLEYIKEIFNTNMKQRAVFGLASGKIITESVSYSGDHKYPKITAKITEQESLPGATRGRSKRLVVGKEEHLDISMAEAGSILFLAKANPTPTGHVNPFIHLDLRTGIIVPNPKFNDIREKTGAFFRKV